MQVDLRTLAGRVQGGALESGPAPLSPLHPKRGARFEEALRKAAQGPDNSQPGLHLSAHAEQRINQRAIPFGEAQRASLVQGLDTLAAKGARDALIVHEGSAFVVNVPNRTVVTALSSAETPNRIFTQIDSTLFI